MPPVLPYYNYTSVGFDGTPTSPPLGGVGGDVPRVGAHSTMEVALSCLLIKLNIILTIDLHLGLLPKHNRLIARGAPTNDH